MAKAGDTDKLKGMKEICAFTRRSESSVMQLINSAGFPAHKSLGIWESSRESIRKWNQKMSESGAVRMIGEP